MKVEEVPVEDIYAVRRAVLRTGTPTTNVDWAGDREPATRHLAVRDDDGEVVAVTTWREDPLPDLPDVPAVQLRGMAVAESHQRQGLGATLIEAGVADAASRGAQLVWANARDSALDFYRANGFDVIGEGFVTEDTRLPHHRIFRRI